MSAVEEIKQKLDIVEVVSSYGVPLKKAGRSFKACCPFHPEKTPSFIVNPDRQDWHCFGACSTGGDVFAFVMRWEKLDFPGALRLLAGRAGITLMPRREETREKPNDRLFQMNEAATLYYHHLLRTSSAGEQARRYLEQRGIAPKIIEEYQLGYSPPGWDELSRHLAQKGYNIEEMVSVGLLVEKEKGGAYDRFRHRLIFPILDREGRVTGFGARALDDSLPKYLNSPQTPIFDKSNALYGIYQAQRAIRKQDQAVIVEGYMDVLMAHQNGYQNVVASLGTALTERQVDQLKRLTKNLVLALDADSAGEEATLRGLAVAQAVMDRRAVAVPTRSGRVRLEEELDGEIRIAVLDGGKDPDEVIRQEPSLWEGAIGAARPIIDYLFSTVTSRLDLSRLRDKSVASSQLLPVIAEIKNPISRAHYLQRLAQLIQVDERMLQDKLEELTTRPRGKKDRTETGARTTLTLGDNMEDYCLSLLLRHPELRERGRELTPEFFSDMENRQIFQTWLERGDPDSVWEGLDDCLRPRFDALMTPDAPDPVGGRLETVFCDCLDRLQERHLKRAIAQLGLLAQEAEAAGNGQRASELKNEELELTGRLVALYRGRSRIGRGSGGGRPASLSGDRQG
jgi:DNA primase